MTAVRQAYDLIVSQENFKAHTNLVPRVLRLFGQQLVARRDSEDSKQVIFLDWLPQFPRVSPGDRPLEKEPEDSEYEIGAHAM